MNVTCQECQSIFRVDPARVVGREVRARCSVCGGIIPVSEHARWGDDFPDARLPLPVRRDAAPMRAPSVRPEVSATGSTSRAPLFAGPVRSSTPPASAAVFPASSLRPPTPAFVPSQAPSTPRTPTPAAVVPPASPATPAPAPVAIPVREAQTDAVRPAPPAAPVVAPSLAASPATRRPINPFLANDPNQKARRLARVLVSDMVTYHPQKRDEGLRSGTLKQLFRDEIRKSYEEYVEQVGREFAEATSHFQEALNEILAGGKRIF